MFAFASSSMVWLSGPKSSKHSTQVQHRFHSSTHWLNRTLIGNVSRQWKSDHDMFARIVAAGWAKHSDAMRRYQIFKGAKVSARPGFLSVWRISARLRKKMEKMPEIARLGLRALPIVGMPWQELLFDRFLRPLCARVWHICCVNSFKNCYCASFARDRPFQRKEVQITK